MAMNISRDVGVGALLGAHLLSRPAQEFGNDPNVEAAWAMKAVEHMEVYFNLLCSVDPRLLKLTPHDDAIYKEFRETFPDFPIPVLCVEKIKNEESKLKWRSFCDKFANVVEDYNFGTLIRIDSSDEYTEKNSLLVLRIQFYAIEITRNREGCNDGIREKFKPSRRTKEPTHCINGCWKTKIVRDIERIFENLCSQYNLSPVPVRQFLRKESGSECKGDISVFLGSPHMEQFLPFVNQIVHQIKSSKYENQYLSDCRISSGHHIQFTLDRPSIFCGVLSDVFKMKECYGGSNCGEGISVLIYVCNSNISLGKNLMHLRSELIAQYFASVLQYNGFQVFLAGDLSSKILQGKLAVMNVEHINCTEECNTDKLWQSLLKQVKDSKWRKDPDLVSQTRKTSCDANIVTSHDDIVLESRKYLLEKSELPNYKAYFKKMDSIYVKADGSNDIFQTAVRLKHFVSDHMTMIPEWILCIGPESKGHLMQSSGLLFEMLSDKMSLTQQIYVTHVAGSYRNQHENEVDYVVRKIKHLMEMALIHKYGQEVLEVRAWIHCIDVLTETVCRFDLLSNPTCSPKVAYGLDDKTPERKRGTFVQYSCARLAQLFQKHEELVNEGRYSRLPELEEVDFSVLKLQEEWNLLFKYIMPFPMLVRSVYHDMCQSPSATIPCSSREICRMLMDLSQDLSQYYNRTRILLEPVPHLQKTMAARIWLLRAVHQVMKNALSLLGIEALEQM